MVSSLARANEDTWAYCAETASLNRTRALGQVGTARHAQGARGERRERQGYCLRTSAPRGALWTGLLRELFPASVRRLNRRRLDCAARSVSE